LNISLVIFCYNERESIERVIQACVETMTQMSDDYEIILVDDGSTDGSQALLEHHESIRYIRHGQNKGIGAALLTGYLHASKEYVCAVPGDGQFDITELLAIEAFNFDRFYSFYRPSTDYSPYRQALTLVNKWFNNYILGMNLRDVNWVKVYRKDQLDFVQPELRSSIVESEICCKLIKSGVSPIELPSVYHRRESGEAKGGKWHTLQKAIREIVSLYLVTSRFNKVKIK